MGGAWEEAGVGTRTQCQSVQCAVSATGIQWVVGMEADHKLEMRQGAEALLLT